MITMVAAKVKSDINMILTQIPIPLQIFSVTFIAAATVTETTVPMPVLKLPMIYFGILSATTMILFQVTRKLRLGLTLITLVSLSRYYATALPMPSLCLPGEYGTTVVNANTGEYFYVHFVAMCIMSTIRILKGNFIFTAG